MNKSTTPLSRNILKLNAIDKCLDSLFELEDFNDTFTYEVLPNDLAKAIDTLRNVKIDIESTIE